MTQTHLKSMIKYILHRIHTETVDCLHILWYTSDQEWSKFHSSVIDDHGPFIVNIIEEELCEHNCDRPAVNVPN